jgi:hypothetical protein
MTTHIPAITVPAVVFETPAASILLPVALGSAVGWSARRKQHLLPSKDIHIMGFTLVKMSCSHHDSKPHEATLQGAEAASAEPTAICLRSRLDGSVRGHGIRSSPSLDHWNHLA